jgi:DNA-binding MarR family transcriptional regulator
VDPSLPDADLGRLLAYLLRAVSPAAMGAALRIDQAAGEAEPTPAPGPAPAARAAEKEDTGAGGAAGGDGGSQGGALGGAGARDGAAGREAAGGRGGADGRGGARNAPAGVSVSEARALIELVAARGIAQGQLAGLLGLEKSTVSRLAAGLERKGWLRRGRDEHNQRYIRLYLTPAGAAVAGQVWRAWQSRQARIIAALTPQERAGLAAGLRGLIRAMAAEGLVGPFDDAR